MRTTFGAILALLLLAAAKPAATPKPAATAKAGKAITKADLEAASSTATKPHVGADLAMKAVTAKIGAAKEKDDKTLASSILYNWYAMDAEKCWRLQVTRSRADNALNSAMVSEETDASKCAAAK